MIVERVIDRKEAGMQQTYVLEYRGFDNAPTTEGTTIHHIAVYHRRSRVNPDNRDYIGATEFTYRFTTEKPIIRHHPEPGWEDILIILTEKYPKPGSSRTKTKAA
ncbi:hypothetical protein ACFLQN_04750 [Candidatus Aenigmatarchaeota archaeon]